MSYIEVLKSIGYPTDVLVLDFESYFDQDYTLSKMSTVEYINHRLFDFLGCGFRSRPDCNCEKAGFAGKLDLKSCFKLLQSYWDKNFEKVTVVIQNAKFDALILQEKFNIRPPYIIDTVDLARHYDARMSHRLKDLAKMFGLKAKGDTNQFRGLHYEEMDEEIKNNLAVYCNNDTEIEIALFKKLLPLVSNPKMEIPLARHTLGLFLNSKIRFDFKKAKELRQQMEEKINTIIAETGHIKKQLSGNISFVKILQSILPDGEVVPMKYGKNKMIPALAQTDDGCKQLLIHPKKEVRDLMTARQAIKSWPLHIKRINNMTNQAIACDGKLPVDLKYYGGHTGRWSGAGGINLQNLGGRGHTGSGIDPLITAVRGLLCAPDGYLFSITDSAQIEARILAWVAGQNDLLGGFRDGEDIYSTFATTIFGATVRKPVDSNSDSMACLFKIRRGFGKDGILGCGYGMGAKKFYERCLQNDDLRPLFDSGKYNFKFIENLIKTYRGTYKQIPGFWRTVEKCFRWVIKYPHEVISYGYDFETSRGQLQKSLLTFWNESGTVNIRLPSGRCLTYRHCRIAEAGGYSTIQWHYGHLWGGSITENIVQAIARDLLGHWILEFEKNNLPVVLHAHDEIISCVPKRQAKGCLKIALDTMRDAPNWAKGLPLNAEGEISQVYKK